MDLVRPKFAETISAISRDLAALVQEGTIKSLEDAQDFFLGYIIHLGPERVEFAMPISQDEVALGTRLLTLAVKPQASEDEIEQAIRLELGQLPVRPVREVKRDLQ